MARFQSCCCHGSTNPHISSNSIKHNSLCESAHHSVHSQKQKLPIQGRSAFCFQFGKFFKFKSIVPPDSNTQEVSIKISIFFASHNMQWKRTNFSTRIQKLWHRAPPKLWSAQNRAQCHSHPALSPPLICCPVPSVIQQ